MYNTEKFLDVYTESYNGVLAEIANATRRLRQQKPQAINASRLAAMTFVRDELRKLVDEPMNNAFLGQPTNDL
jgi:hypothetical protein